MKMINDMMCRLCSYGCTLEAETWCSNDHFDIPYPNAFPDKTDCEDFKVRHDVTLEDVGVAFLSFAQQEANRLNAKKPSS